MSARNFSPITIVYRYPYVAAFNDSLPYPLRLFIEYIRRSLIPIIIRRFTTRQIPCLPVFISPSAQGPLEISSMLSETEGSSAK